TKHGFHILFATEIFAEERHSIEEVRPQLTRDLLTNRVHQKIETFKKSQKTVIEYRRSDISGLLRQVQTEQSTRALLRIAIKKRLPSPRSSMSSVRPAARAARFLSIGKVRRWTTLVEANRSTFAS